MISFKMLDDWDRRVVIRRRELVPTEEAKLPWHKPPLEMYRRVTEAIHGLDMLKVSIRSYRLFVVFFVVVVKRSAYTPPPTSVRDNRDGIHLYFRKAIKFSCACLEGKIPYLCCIFYISIK